MTDKCLSFYIVTYSTSYILWEELKYFKIVVLRNLSYVGTSYVRKNFVMFHISMEKIFFNHKSQLELLYECIVCDTWFLYFRIQNDRYQLCEISQHHRSEGMTTRILCSETKTSFSKLHIFCFYSIVHMHRCQTSGCSRCTCTPTFTPSPKVYRIKWGQNSPKFPAPTL